MAKLIQLRQRIKAIDTIKKITHAMRLIAMSTHSHLKSLQNPLATYTHTLDTIFAELSRTAPTWHNPIIHPSTSTSNKTLLIIIGSQKGLCGSFNTNLFKLVSYHLDKIQYSPEHLDIIAVGQKAIDFIRNLEKYALKHSYEKCTASRIEGIAQEIAHTLVHAPVAYRTALIASNVFKSFFIQKPHLITLIPFEKKEPIKNELFDEHIWEQSPTEILNIIIPQYLAGHIHSFLFQSILAEHAARFISMDSATRNANNLLETAKREYNKLRQAKITKELTELSGSFS